MRSLCFSTKPIKLQQPITELSYGDTLQPMFMRSISVTTTPTNLQQPVTAFFLCKQYTTQLHDVHVSHHHAHRPATANHSIVLYRRVTVAPKLQQPITALSYTDVIQPSSMMSMCATTTPTYLQQPITALSYTDVLQSPQSCNSQSQHCLIQMQYNPAL